MVLAKFEAKDEYDIVFDIVGKCKQQKKWFL